MPPVGTKTAPGWGLTHQRTLPEVEGGEEGGNCSALQLAVTLFTVDFLGGVAADCFTTNGFQLAAAAEI